MKNFVRTLAAAGMLATAVATPACASEVDGDEDLGGDSASALAMANDDFDTELRRLESTARRCEAEGHCTSDGGLKPASATALAPRGLNFPRQKMCDALRPLEGLGHPYVFVGASMKAAAIKTVTDGGADIVFDLSNRQLAAFTYKSYGVQNLVGVSANVYFGYAFGKKNNVLDAWSGEFQSAEASVESPYLELSVGGAIFRAPDNSLWGALAEVSVGLNALGPVAMVDVGVSEGMWTPWDKATKALGTSYWFVSYEPKTAGVGGAQHTYLQFERARDEGLALVQSLGPLGLVPAAHALALEALQTRGLTFAKACRPR